MRASGRPITLLLFSLFGSATSSPVSLHTPAPPFPSQLFPPSPTILPSPPSPPPSASVSTEEAHCLLMSPSALVVRFGDPAAANCSVSRTGFSALGWEVSPPLQEAPQVTMDGFLVWSVDRMTEWSIQLMCYALSEQGGQCHSDLPVTIYKPPDNVSISFTGHSGPMSGPMTEGHQYSLQCKVQEVAPVQSLIVTFYRGQTPLGQPQSKNNTEKKPVTELFALSVTPSKEDHGVQYWCEAKLQLGPEGPQLPPVVTSQNITATVLYQPQLDGPSHPEPITITEGNPLHLTCSAAGNPTPSYTWTLPSQSHAPSNSSVLTINAVTSADSGAFTCSVSNSLGTVSVTFNVDVQANYMGLIIGVIVAVALLLVILGLIGYSYCYKHNRMGQYNLKDVFRLRSRHSALPTVDFMTMRLEIRSILQSVDMFPV